MLTVAAHMGGNVRPSALPEVKDNTLFCDKAYEEARSDALFVYCRGPQ